MGQFKINNESEAFFRGNFKLLVLANFLVFNFKLLVLNYVAVSSLFFDRLEAYWIFLFRRILFVHI